MRTVIVVCLLSLLGVVLAQETYSDKYDNVDFDQIQSNRQLLLPYVNCVLDQERSSLDCKEMKEVVLGVLQSACADCSPQAKKNVARLIKAIMDQFPEKWYIYYKQYDPEETRTEQLNNFLKENS